MGIVNVWLHRLLLPRFCVQIEEQGDYVPLASQLAGRGVYPLIVFDGAAMEEKDSTAETRQERRAAAQQRLDAELAICDISDMSRNTVAATVLGMEAIVAVIRGLRDTCAVRRRPLRGRRAACLARKKSRQRERRPHCRWRHRAARGALRVPRLSRYKLLSN